MAGSVSNVEVCNLAFSGQLEELRQAILSNKALASKADQDGRTALHWACSAGHTEVVEFLLSLGVEVNLQDDVSFVQSGVALSPAAWTPLHIAASAGREDIVRSLIGKGAQLNSVNQNGCTPLHLACDEERVEAAKLLVEHGASIYIENKEEKTPLQMAKGGLGNILRRIVEG
uniref:Proteasome 26S subunit, non-ATPase 10 n=1 Tax=Fundulus heteroclitus TaxID=8078 RepID=A0A3Q2NQA0_FUNHE